MTRRVIVAVLGMLLFSSIAMSQEFKKKVDRRFPTGLFCPIDPALTLTFTAPGPAATLTFNFENFVDSDWNSNHLDNVAIVPESVFLAHQVVTPDFEFCYFDPGTQNTPGYDFVAGDPEIFLDLLDADASGWSLGTDGYFDASRSAPRDPQIGQDTSGGSLGVGAFDQGGVPVSVSRSISGLAPGETYVVTGWWYTQQLSPMEIVVDFNLPKTLSISGVGFAPEETGAEFVSNSVGALYGAGRFVAPILLPHGSSLLEMTIVSDISGAEVATATLYQVDLLDPLSTSPIPAGTASVPGPTFGTPGSATTTLGQAILDLDNYAYYLAVTQGPNSQTHGVRLLYKDPSPVPTQKVAVAARAFDPERHGVDAKAPYAGGGLGSPNGGLFVAPVRLPVGASITGLTLVALDNDPGEITARLIGLPLLANGGSVLASVSSTGLSPAVRTFSTSSVVNPAVDGSRFHYLELELASGLHLTAFSVEVEYTPPAPGTVSDHLAAAGLPFLAEDSFTDARNPVANALAGQYRFNLPVHLPEGEQVVQFGLYARDATDDGNITAFLYRVDSSLSYGGPQLMARLESQGNDPMVRYFSSHTIRGRAVDNDRYFYYVQLYTGIEPTSANGIRIDTLPCGDFDLDGFDGCTADCDDLTSAVYPGAPQICDGLANDCFDPAWPEQYGTIESDDDFDGFSECAGDCVDSDSTIWSPPGEVTGLTLAHDAASGFTTLQWSAPSNPGDLYGVLYDVLGSLSPSNFVSAGFCSQSNGPGLTMSLLPGFSPQVGAAFFFRVRPQGVCGHGPLGFTSNGAPVSGRNCP